MSDRSPEARWAAFGRIIALARPEWPRLALATAALLVTTALNLVWPRLIQEIVDGVVGGEGIAVVDRFAGLLLGLFALGAVLTGFRGYLFTIAGERIVANLRSRLYSAIAHLDIAFFDGQKTGELVNRLASDTTVVQRATTVNVSMLMRYALTVLGAIGILFFTSWKLTVVMLALVPDDRRETLVTFGRSANANVCLNDAVADSGGGQHMHFVVDGAELQVTFALEGAHNAMNAAAAVAACLAAGVDAADKDVVTAEALRLHKRAFKAGGGVFQHRHAGLGLHPFRPEAGLAPAARPSGKDIGKGALCVAEVIGAEPAVREDLRQCRGAAIQADEQRGRAVGQRTDRGHGAAGAGALGAGGDDHHRGGRGAHGGAKGVGRRHSGGGEDGHGVSLSGSGLSGAR